MYKIFFITLLSILSFTQITQAQNKQQAPEQMPKNMKKVFYSIGAGSALIPEYEGAKHYRLLPLVNFSANWINGKYIRINGLNTEVNLLASRKWNFGPTIMAKVNRNDNNISNNKVANLPELNLAIGAGIFGQYTFKKYFLKASYTHDISGVNHGGLANLELGYNYRKKRVIARASLNTSFATEKYLNTYFGVDNLASLASTLPQYQLNTGFKDIGLNTSFIYSLNQKWMLGTAVRYSLLIGKVADSPIVQEGSEHQFTTALFALYRF